MEKTILKKKNLIIFTPYFNPEPFPINTFVSELSKKEEIQSIKVITSLPNYRKYGFYNGYSILGPYSEKKDKVSIARLLIIPRFSNSIFAIFLFYLSFFFSSFVYLLFFSILNRNKYQHILTFCGSPVYVGYLGFFASKLLNTKSSQWIQDIWPEAIQTTVGLRMNFLARIIRLLQDKMWNYCDILFAESESLKKYLSDIFPKKKVITLYNPVRNLNNKKNYSNKTEKLIFTYAGNIGGAQNLEIVLDAFSKLDKKKYELHMCGDGPLLNVLNSKYDYDNVYWHGWVENEKFDKIISKSDYFILSLKSSGRQALILPSKLQTYFQLQKPVFCISDGAVKDLVDNIKSGVTTDANDLDEVYKLFVFCSQQSENERQKMAENGYNYYINNFKSSVIVDKFLNNI